MRFKRLKLLPLPLMLVLLASPVPAVEERDYYAIYADGQKIGQSVETRKVEGRKVTSFSSMELTISRGAVPLTVRQQAVSIETDDGKPLGFKSVQDLSIMSQTAEGTVDRRGTVTLVLNSGGQLQQKTFPWPRDALLSEGLRLLRKQQGLKEGTTYSASAFDMSGFQAVNATITVGGKKKVDLAGREAELTQLTTVMNGPTGTIQVIEHVNDEFKTLKTMMPIMGMNLEIVAVDPKVADSANKPVDMLSKTVLASPIALEDLASVKSATYTLTPIAAREHELSVPSLPNQEVRRIGGPQVMVTVSAVSATAGASFPYAGGDIEALAALKPTRYVESDRPEVVALARQAVGDTKDAAEAVRRIEKFVRGYIRNKDMTVGYASAAEVVEKRKGDCSEHAVLAAALCRAVGIPAQVVAGAAYVSELGQRRHIFGPHAWVRARVGDKWVGLDATFPGGWDVGHIALAVGDGNPTDFIDMASTLGYFKITQVLLKR